MNLGAGELEIPGFLSLDGKTGDCLYPLPYADASVDVIRSSHVLEHFPHGEVQAVVTDWVRALKPGGLLQIAVPDHAVMRKLSARDAQGFYMGGQCDLLDYHKTLFDRPLLTELLRGCGLVAIRPWTSEIQDCASLPVSLNLAGNKPQPHPKIAAVISMPRLGFNDFWSCAYTVLGGLGLPLRKTSGAYWDRSITQGIDEAMAEHDPEWILTCDYDTLFTREHLADMINIVSRYPHIDALAPLQVARWHGVPMFTLENANGEAIRQVERESLVHGEILKSKSAHFGLTLLRAEALRRTKRPWFERQYTAEGQFQGDGSADPDVGFWLKWKAAGNTLYTALRVPIGHAELLVRWPDLNLEATHQLPGDFWKQGPPSNIWR